MLTPSFKTLRSIGARPQKFTLLGGFLTIAKLSSQKAKGRNWTGCAHCAQLNHPWGAIIRNGCPVCCEYCPAQPQGTSKQQGTYRSSPCSINTFYTIYSEYTQICKWGKRVRRGSLFTSKETDHLFVYCTNGYYLYQKLRTPNRRGAL